MPDETATLGALRKKVQKFIRARDWEQFHSAKNIAMSLTIEAAELMEIFQWHERLPEAKLTAEEKKRVRHELADIVIYALDFCNQFDIDLSEAILSKLRHNERKYPASKVRGKTHKYTYYKKLARRSRGKNKG